MRSLGMIWTDRSPIRRMRLKIRTAISIFDHLDNIFSQTLDRYGQNGWSRLKVLAHMMSLLKS